MSVHIDKFRAGPVTFVRLNNNGNCFEMQLNTPFDIDEEAIWLTILGWWDIPTEAVFAAYNTDINARKEYKKMIQESVFINEFFGSNYLSMKAEELGWYNGVTQNR